MTARSLLNGVEIMERRTERAIIRWVSQVGDYRTLIGKRDWLGQPLPAEESERLEQLEHHFAAVVNPERGPFCERGQRRAPLAIAVRFRTPSGSVKAGVLLNLSGEGAYVSSATLLPIGSVTELQIVDPATGDEWRFGAGIVRHDGRVPVGMGLRLIGIPLILRFGHRGGIHEVMRAA